MDRHGKVCCTNRISLCMDRGRQQPVNLRDETRLGTRLGVFTGILEQACRRKRRRGVTHKNSRLPNWAACGNHPLLTSTSQSPPSRARVSAIDRLLSLSGAAFSRCIFALFVLSGGMLPGSNTVVPNSNTHSLNTFVQALRANHATRITSSLVIKVAGWWRLSLYALLVCSTVNAPSTCPSSRRTLRTRS